MTYTYSFTQQKAVGTEAEAVLDRWVDQFYRLRPATMAQQRQGIDRQATHRLTGRQFTLEYKADGRAYATGNAFVETLSVAPDKPGWAVTCTADHILYWVRNGGLYICRPIALRAHLPEWRRTCEPRSITNRGYSTKGLLVPLAQFSAASDLFIPENMLLCKP